MSHDARPAGAKISPAPEGNLTKSRTDQRTLNRAIGKAARHLLPMLVILYFVAFLDRTNVGFAQEGLHVDARVSDAAFAWGAGIFFIGYAIFEIPSNLLLRRFGARFWLARIAVTWGIVASLFAFTTNETVFVILRFLLGLTEAGLFPGVIMFLSAWFPNTVRVQMFAVFYLAQPFSQMIGAPLSGALVSFGEALTPWHGWQVMFFTEGLLAVIAGIAALFWLTNSPNEAKFLNSEEKLALSGVMELEDFVRHSDGPTGLKRSLLNWKVWYFTLIYFCLQIAVYGVTFFLPQQVSVLVGLKVGWQVGLLSAIPWFVGLFACYWVGKNATTLRRRRVWGVWVYLLTGVGIIGSAWAGATGAPALGIAFITLAVAAFLCAGPITWAFPTAFLTGTAAAAGIGLINSLGNLGGFVAPLLRTQVNAWVPTASGAWGVLALGVFALVAAVLIAGTARMRAKSDELLES